MRAEELTAGMVLSEDKISVKSTFISGCSVIVKKVNGFRVVLPLGTEVEVET